MEHTLVVSVLSLVCGDHKERVGCLTPGTLSVRQRENKYPTLTTQALPKYNCILGFCVDK